MFPKHEIELIVYISVKGFKKANETKTLTYISYLYVSLPIFTSSAMIRKCVTCPSLKTVV